jgi:hypothetical protein
MYRVLRGGRQRSTRSVDRERTGRNASEGSFSPEMHVVEAADLFTLWGMRNPYHRHGKGEMEASGVRTHGMLSRVVLETREIRSVPVELVRSNKP